MTYEEAKQLATTLYWTASSQHDVDDQQWRSLFNIFNKKYWNDVARNTGSLFAKDSPDLISDSAGMFDYSGSLYNLNDLVPAQVTNISAAGGWTLTNVTTATGYFGPDNTNTAWQMTDTASTGSHLVTVADSPTYNSGDGVVTVWAKRGTLNFIYLTDGGSNSAWFNLSTGALGTVTSPLSASISPMPAPSFSTAMGTTSGLSPVTSDTGWYKCSIKTDTGGVTSISAVTIGMSNADAVTSYTGNTSGTVFLWGPRKAYRDNVVDPSGVYMPLACELKFLGRYIHLDTEIPQDRYIYNIAFGQVQVLIPTAWTLMGEKIVMLPRTSGGQTFRFTYVPRVSEMIIDTQHFLNGYLSQFHQLIVYESVASMLRQGMDVRPILGPLAEMKEQWKAYLNSRQRQGGRKIRFVPYE